jgi:hypothetical protein
MLSQIFLFCYSGPLNALLANTVDAQMRGRAFSISILLIHLLGDAASPTAIGIIADKFGSLKQAVSLLPLLLLITALWWSCKISIFFSL